MAKTTSIPKFITDGDPNEIELDNILYADMATVQEEPGEVIITDPSAPIDRPHTLRYAVQNVNNVYSGTSIDPSVYAPTRRGVSLVIQNNVVASVTDTNDSSYRVDLPISAHLVIKVPASDYLTSGQIYDIIRELYSGLYDQSGSPKIGALIRGALKPNEI